MITIPATVSAHSLMLGSTSSTKQVLPTGSFGIDRISFSISGVDWTSSNTIVKAQFWRDDSSEIYEATVTNNVAIIPKEVLKTTGRLYIALYGITGSTKRISTNAVCIEIEQGSRYTEIS